MGQPSSPRDRRGRTSVATQQAPVRRGPLQVVGRTVSKAWWDNIFSESASAAFWQALSLPPLLLGLLGSVGFLGDWFGPGVVDAVHSNILAFSRTVFTGNVVDQIIGPTVADILTKGRSEIVSVGFLLSLWAGSSALASLVDSITLAYDQYLVRNSVWQRVFALLLYLVCLVLAVVGLPVVALGPEWLQTLLPEYLRDDAAWVIHGFYYPATGVFLVLALATLYKVSLPRKLPWHRGLPGALLAMLVFLCSSIGLRLYIAWVTGTGYTYGALATPIAFLLFGFFIGMAVIIGAQFNNAIQEMHPARLTRRERRRWRRLEMKRIAQRMHTERGYQTWRAGGAQDDAGNTGPAAGEEPEQRSTTEEQPDPEGSGEPDPGGAAGIPWPASGDEPSRNARQHGG
ncbi:YihY/virulence factor BrkB family protein [Saccharopolyspora sp. HNM0983]|uniref:YihY/virulence factor BrkB family protein n=1 Tax=Saccharopolyspora montiporae TaxID=2781240 RepID=A0A929B6B9_9PSEU|nr:YihY/virulence factor BrkB family protein [Saccharopolyspora sp. HNM0983]MBE9373066.1 YihY/virulence factor BrkB family protein [Saccharopolyspora sp. HNM0983]